ncbi:TIGR02391 family protein [Bradyrhizobium sp. CCGUVB23]|uniref:TIGR02391 family protein n=1 Tax=Bradyrhizobium sp. CCGUVB23 TaxID=2949630 RepID=UPI003531A888
MHLAIREDVWAHHHGGKFDTAVFEAMNAVEVAVRDASKLPAGTSRRMIVPAKLTKFA